MDRPEPSASATRKYVVAPRFGRGGVKRNSEDCGVFATQADAVRFACGQARDGAHDGILGIVVGRAEVQEIHSFNPPPDVAAACASARPRFVRPDA